MKAKGIVKIHCKECGKGVQNFYWKGFLFSFKVILIDQLPTEFVEKAQSEQWLNAYQWMTLYANLLGAVLFSKIYS